MNEGTSKMLQLTQIRIQRTRTHIYAMKNAKMNLLIDAKLASWRWGSTVPPPNKIHLHLYGQEPSALISVNLQF